MSDMKYFQALDCIIRELEIADPALGAVYVLKDDVGNGFYHIALWHGDTPNLGLVLPSAVNREDLVAILLTLPMGWGKPCLYSALPRRQSWTCPMYTCAAANHTVCINWKTVQKRWS